MIQTLLSSPVSRWLVPVLLLIGSNVFMTYAWYYHLKVKTWPLLVAIGFSWGIALFEYCLQVPANRMGHVSNGGAFTAPQLKIIQEAITLIVFTVFTLLVLREKPRMHDFIAMGLILLAVIVSMMGRRGGGGH
ncbi:MAG: DMT family protein [Phycisphaeraceae bacterium]|nr:DMT family protein [Phycisphaeraceae bacterium]MBX3366569.1 DMT family protein [Phycisphaeraceae bacterium]